MAAAYLKPQHISADARDMSLYISEHTEIEVSILKVYGPLSSFSSENSASNALLVRIKNTGNRAITRVSEVLSSLYLRLNRPMGFMAGSEEG